MTTLDRFLTAKAMLQFLTTLIPIGAIVLGSVIPALAAPAEFGPANPFYAPSTLPFQAPPFDKIKDDDYQPAIEAGMEQQKAELLAIADKAGACLIARCRRAARPRAPIPIRSCKKSRASRPRNSPRTRTSSISTPNSL